MARRTPKPVSKRANLTQGQADAAVRRFRGKLVKLKTPAADTQMCDTLLLLLQSARDGQIQGFSICLIGTHSDGTEFSIESACADGDGFRELQLLGTMRMAEEGLLRRRRERLGQED